jgi:hypothetical protein
MNTPAHLVINLVILGRKEQPEIIKPIVIGAILPDLPMVLFYFCQKVLRGMPEHFIWSQAYYENGWQMFFDLFNSLPLVVLGFVLAHRLGARRPIALFASMALHTLADASLHHDDAHRHLFPLSDWRFYSPISYWDPRHFGYIVAPLEAITVVVLCIVLARRFDSILARVLIACVVAVYAVYWGYALWVWT